MCKSKHKSLIEYQIFFRIAISEFRTRSGLEFTQNEAVELIFFVF